MSKPFTWSYSQLNKYELCPRQWEAANIYRKREVETPEMKEGYRVHDALAARAHGCALPPDLAHLEKFGVAIDHAKSLGWQVMAEQKIGLTRDWQRTEWMAPNVYLRVVMDLNLVGPSHAIIADYKTGNPRYHDATQLAIFAAAGMHLWPAVNTVDTKYLWTRTGGQNQEVYRREELRERVMIPLLTRVAAMEQGVADAKFPAKPSWACKGCVATDCEHWKART